MKYIVRVVTGTDKLGAARIRRVGQLIFDTFDEAVETITVLDDQLGMDVELVDSENYTYSCIKTDWSREYVRDMSDHRESMTDRMGPVQS